MKRRTLDALLIFLGLTMMLVLVAAGGLLTWAHSFISGQVRTQLSAQQIFFPVKGDPALAPSVIGTYLNQYAGQQLVTGQQAEAYADHFIAVHLRAIGGGKTYSELSAAAKAQPNNTVLAGQVETVFKGETLRGLLLNAYAFGKMGTIAGGAAVGAFVGALLIFLLAGLGLLHLRRTSPDRELFPLPGSPSPQPAAVA